MKVRGMQLRHLTTLNFSWHVESMIKYPQVMDEIVTIDKLVKGKYKGIARFGDGDFNILRGQSERYHKACPRLANALATILHAGSNHVLNCLIPPPPAYTREGNLAFQRWAFYLEMNAGLLPFLSDEIYGSSNISRMDSCPHLHTISWWNQVAELWRDRDICLVRGTERSLTNGKMMNSPGAPRVIREVICKPMDSFEQLDEIFQKVIDARRDIVIICAGMMARPLVHKLVEAGLYAYDLGHFGQWFSNGAPIPLVDVPR